MKNKNILYYAVLLSASYLLFTFSRADDNFGVNHSFGQQPANVDTVVLDDTIRINRVRQLLQSDMKKTVIAQSFTELMQKWHYKKLPINDSISEKIYHRFLDLVDGARTYLFEEDIEAFKRYKHQLDDALLTGDIRPFYDLYNAFSERYENRYRYAVELLNKEFDFTIDEDYVYDRKKMAFKNLEEADEFWRKRVKYELLMLQIDTNNVERNKKVLKERYENILNNFFQTNSNDIFQVILDSYAKVGDPHSTFLVPNNADNFNIAHSLSYAGIGATLTSRNEVTEIVSVNPKGPAYKTEAIFAGDRIIGVAQGDDGAFENVIGWRIDNVVAKIRGKKDSVVRLKVIPKDKKLSSEPTIITIVRDIIVLEDNKAKASIVTSTLYDKTYKMGVIPLQSFYLDFKALQRGDKNYNSTSRDVKHILDSLKEENVQGLVLDLRNNGGGSLKEAIDLTGLFIDKGPIVQVKDTQDKIYIDKDSDPAWVWDKPLVVLINRNSASASEILAGAIQDYKVGIVLGENSYGKGTVQQVVDLNKIVPQAEGRAGQLNLTIAKFYRITGASTQFKGITPDLSFPNPPNFEDIGEKSREAALPWDLINPCAYNEKDLVSTSLIETFRENFKNYYQNHPEYLVLQKQYEEMKKEEKESKGRVTLHMKKFEEEREAERLEGLKKKNEYRKILGLKELALDERVPEGEARADLYRESAIHILKKWIAKDQLEAKIVTK